MESEEPYQSGLDETANDESECKPASPLAVNLYDYVDPLASIVKEEHDLEIAEEDPMEMSGASTSQGQVLDVVSHNTRGIMNSKAQDEVAAAVMSLLADPSQLVTKIPDDDERNGGTRGDEECPSSGDEAERRYRQYMAMEELDPSLEQQDLTLEGPEQQHQVSNQQLRLPSSENSVSKMRANKRLVSSMPGQLQAFGRYVADELESLPTKKAVEIQAKIMRLLAEAHLKH